LAPRSRRPHSRPNRTPVDLEEQIVRLRKDLVNAGFDGGARTIHWHIAQLRADCPSTSTIWRVLSRRGFIEPEPKERPQSSLIRFEAALPNECWQGDVTHWKLRSGRDVEILDFIDDHSRPDRRSQGPARDQGRRRGRHVHRSSGHLGLPGLGADR
jgi:hypothetical protein